MIEGLVRDGRPLLALTGVALLLSGGFALFLSATGQFLPHDTQYLGMTAERLCSMHGCRIVHFMFHDRVSFGGVLIAIGLLYLWLTEFPLRNREAWAWWTLVLSGLAGFGTFLAYLGYGYLDTWHGIATLFLLPIFLLGLRRSYRTLAEPRHVRSVLAWRSPLAWRSRLGLGRVCLLLTAVGMIFGGLTIMIVGMTTVFVPQDLEFMGVETLTLRSLSPRLIPLIAHDRAGFGGGLLSCGITMFLVLWHGTPSRSLWQAVASSGTVGFSTALGIHPVVGYLSLSHLAPAILGAGLFLIGLSLTFGPMTHQPQDGSSRRW